MNYDKQRSSSFTDTQIQHFQTSIPQKTLRPFETNFPMEPAYDVWIKCVQMFKFLMTKMAFRPIYCKNLQTLPCLEPRRQWH